VKVHSELDAACLEAPGSCHIDYFDGFSETASDYCFASAVGIPADAAAAGILDYNSVGIAVCSVPGFDKEEPDAAVVVHSQGSAGVVVAAAKEVCFEEGAPEHRYLGPEMDSVLGIVSFVLAP
jgi:hypothetical protein